MSNYVLIRIEALQKELETLKKVVNHQLQDSKQTTQLRGLWKGVETTEEEILEAKKVAFRNAYEWED
ncbi:MAG: hypothetical protein ACRC2S_19430 [Waterburya sp.]